MVDEQISYHCLKRKKFENSTFYINRDYQKQQSRPITRTALLFISKKSAYASTLPGPNGAIVRGS